MTNPFARYRAPPPPPPPAPSAPPPPPAPSANAFSQFRRTAPPVAPPAPPPIAPTRPTRDIPARQANVRTPTDEDGNLGDVIEGIRRIAAPFVAPWEMVGRHNQRDQRSTAEVFTRASRYLEGSGRRQDGVGEIAYQSVPERDGEDVQWEGGPLSGVLNAMPAPVRAWLDAEGRAARIGFGLFLNMNEEDRAHTISSNVPTAQFRRDEYGNLQVRFAEDTPWAYINRPGASVQDAQDLASVMARYYPASRLATLPTTFTGRAVMSSGASAATEYASQQADDFVGGPEGVRGSDVALAGVTGGGGQMVFDAGAAAYQMARPTIRRILGSGADAPLPAPGSTAAAYADEVAPPPPRDFAAEREAIEQRAASDYTSQTDQTYNSRVMTTVDPLAGVDDAMQYGAGRTREDIRAALARGEPVYISDEGYRPVVDGVPATGLGYVRRVQSIDNNGRITWADSWQGGVPDDGLVVPASPAASQLNGGQERVIDDYIQRTRRVEQERRAALARLDNEEFGTDFSPPSILHDAARAAMAEHRPVFVSTPNGVRRVAQVIDEGFIDDAGEFIPSAGTIAEMTDDGLLFSTPPRPTARQTQSAPPPPPPPPPTGPATASDIYEMSDEFGIPVTRGEARQDVTQRTKEFDMLFGAYGPGAQRQAASFQDHRALALDEAGRRIAARGQEPLARNVDDAGQIIQNQIRERHATLTQSINQAYDDAMTALSEVPVSRSAGQTLGEIVHRRLMYGRGNLDEGIEELLPTTGYDPDIMRNTTKSRPGTALRMLQSLQDEIVSRAALGRNQVRFSHVERVRQRLLELQQDAHAASDPDTYAMDLIIEGVDDWLQPALRQPPAMRIRTQGQAFEAAEQQQQRERAEQAILRARQLYAQREELFSRSGANDLAGRTMEQVRGLDTTGTKTIDLILGAGRVPPSQAMAAVQRIVDIANRSTSRGTLATAGERTTNSARFEGGTAHPAPEIQALREALFMRILEPLRTRGQGNQVPIQTIVNNLDTAINGPGRAITRAMFTEPEVVQIERLLSVLRYYTPTTASRPTGVMAARLLGGSVDAIVRMVGGAPGALLRGLVGIINPGVKDAAGDIAARQAFSRPMLQDGLPTTQSGSAYGQLARDYGVDDSGVDAPLDLPPSTAERAYNVEPQSAAGAYGQNIVSGDMGETITIEVDGQFYNIPTVINGERMNVSTALRLWEEGQNPELGTFATEDEATSAARDRRRQRAAGAEPAGAY